MYEYMYCCKARKKIHKSVQILAGTTVVYLSILQGIQVIQKVVYVYTLKEFNESNSNDVL